MARDNRDPRILGRFIEQAARTMPGTRASQRADHAERTLLVPDFREAVAPNVPMCGFPPEGRRALTNGKPGTKIDPAGMDYEG